ncbi:LacI family transcriptional regulator [Acinetobacter sp. ANC 4558]|uniref:LacI family DNA-binding transcriptional regulator n=1 Tax=Acinetobacter sp. ANC 4558 TaxID=1977876 RepID=UPI000A33D7DE|nr:LacI family DNA-binding transcriptional regulator [Acinetobacter sp. ANC 4558]OTG85485.1 LacI family transcriptional regulator [Acinetobacter sp. ANC 4558]
MARSNTKNVTLKFLSEQLGLHVSTVSRVLNGGVHDAETAASPETIKKIRELAQSLNYTPNTLAKSLKSQKSQVVGVLVPKLSDLVLATIYEGIDAAATKHNYVTFVSNTNDVPKNQRKLGEMALSRRVDGLIIADAHLNNAETTEFFDFLTQRDIPFVLVSRGVDGFPSVTCDDYLGGRLAAEHFLSSGKHQCIGILAGEPFASTGYLRAKGFKDYCFEHGVQLLEKNIIHSGFDVDSGYHAGLQLLSQENAPSAVFAVNDFIAIGLMGAVKKLNLLSGKDISIIGFNDISLAKQLPIPLSSINSPMYAMGFNAFELLLKIMNGSEAESLKMKPTIMCRESSLDYQHHS